MLEKILIFIIFLGPLVFFHELGHFLFARLFGVRVEVFSIGFGPKLFKFKRGDTDYCISAIPLGGYVKMFGDDPMNMEAVPVEDRPMSFTHKSKWARFWIVMGGPLANFILAYVIFFTLLVGGEKVPELRIGMIPETSSLFQAGLRPGDSLRMFNDKPVLSPTDIALEGTNPVKSVAVMRAGEILTLPLNMTGEQFLNELIQYPPALRKPYLVNKSGETFLLSRTSDGPTVKFSLDEMSLLTGVEAYQVLKVPASFSEENLAKQNLEVVESFELTQNGREDLLSVLREKGFTSKDLMARSILQGSAADQAGLKMNDTIIGVNGEGIYSFDSLVNKIQNETASPILFSVWSAGEAKDLQITPVVKLEEGKERKLIGVYSSAEFVPIEFIQTESKGLFASVPLAMARTWDVTKKTLEGFRMLFTAQVSLKTIGGPIAIGQVASDSFNTSLTYFFQLMALISINLGIINLLPIPVLDGGHIVFIMLEAINRGPISRRKMEIAQQVGLSLLLLLMVGALFNDVSRFF